MSLLLNEEEQAASSCMPLEGDYWEGIFPALLTVLCIFYYGNYCRTPADFSSFSFVLTARFFELQVIF